MEQDFVKKELKKYNLSDAKIAELKSKYLKLIVKSTEDIDAYMACKSAHQEVKGLRVTIEKKRVELKASSLAFGKAIDTEAKRITVGISEVEDHLLKQRKVVDDEKKKIQEERERKEQEEQDRIKKEEEDRLEKIRQEQEEKERQLKEQQDKIDKEKEENRLEKERLEKEKADAKENEKKAIEDKKRAEAEEKERKEKEEKAAKEREKQRLADIEKAKEEERDRIAREEKEKELAAFKAKEAEIEARNKASDKDKLSTLASTIKSIEFPVVKSNASEEILAKVDGLLKQASKLLTEAKG